MKEDSCRKECKEEKRKEGLGEGKKNKGQLVRKIILNRIKSTYNNKYYIVD